MEGSKIKIGDSIRESMDAERRKEIKEDNVKVTNTKTGMVTNCEHLCVRKEPNTTSEIVAIIAESTKVKITNEAGEWYAVTTEPISHFVNAIDGYCMKKYITEE